MKFRSVYPPRPKGERWQVQGYLVGGKQKSATFATESAAKQRYREWLATVELSAPMADFPEYDGRLDWWLRLMAKTAHELHRTRDKELRNDLKAYAHAAVASKSLYDIAEIERRLEVLEQQEALEETVDAHDIVAQDLQVRESKESK